INNAAMLVSDFLHETNPATQELEININEYIYIIDQPTVTEDILIDDGIIEAVMDEFGEDNNNDDDDDKPPPPPVTMAEAVEALEKVIRYQESLDLGIGFDEYELVTLRKRLKEWRSEKEKNKKQSSLLSFFGGTSTAS
ncbi:25683_t:CDS:1, partial [Gigaspora rosea]